MKGVRATLLAVVLSLAGLDAPAYAQWDPGATASMGQMMGSTNLMIGNLSLGRAELQRQSGSGAGQGPARGVTFNASPGVAAEFRAKFIETLVKRNPARETELRSEFARIDIDRAFAHALSIEGLSSLNLGDTVTANWVISWEIVNNEADPAPVAIRSVAAAVRAKLMANPAITGASDRDKQVLEEQLAYQTVMAQSAATAARASGNAAALASLRQALIDKFHGMNVNLTALRMTDHGFVPK